MAASFMAGWRQVVVCFLLLAGATMLPAIYSIIAVPLAREFETSRMVLMLAMTMIPIVQCSVRATLL